MRTSYRRGAGLAAVLGCTVSLLATGAAAQTWTRLANTPAFFPGAVLLLTDGTVIAQDVGDKSNVAATGNWWKLTPDTTGSYVNGTWSQLASMPAGYGPLYYASEVLPDGRVIINGGEYNIKAAEVWTTKGAIYDPIANSWKSVAPPSGWTTIGDAQSVLLDDGTYLLANCCTTDAATLDLKTMTWTPYGTGKADIYDEEGWTLLPGGGVLTVDTRDGTNTEILTNGVWASAGNTPKGLTDPNSLELGPQVLRPNGTVLAIGATGYTAIYNIAKKSWSAGPTFPKVGSAFLDAADGPASLLVNGNVLAAVSPGVYKTGLQFFEIKGATLVAAPNIPNAANDSSFYVHLLPLPNGQVMETDFSNDVEIYTPVGSPSKLLAPTIAEFPATVTHGSTYKLIGKHLNGFSQAAAYGDDYQANTNYPIVRITNTATGHVFYARTANHSSMAVANPKLVSTQVTIPAGIETGASTIVVVANGIASSAKSITVN